MSWSSRRRKTNVRLWAYHVPTTTQTTLKWKWGQVKIIWARIERSQRFFLYECIVRLWIVELTCLGTWNDAKAKGLRDQVDLNLKFSVRILTKWCLCLMHIFSRNVYSAWIETSRSHKLTWVEMQGTFKVAFW